jgi:hypothetical protein
MRRRNLPKHKVTPLPGENEDLAAQKIQALFRGRKARSASTNMKLKAMSRLLLELRTRVRTLEASTNIQSPKDDTEMNIINNESENIYTENIFATTTIKKRKSMIDEELLSEIPADGYILSSSMWEGMLG